ncbi:hypothetical protein SAMN05443999_103214 [Roseovarius azorensis]|uniref:Outer membrane protein beta-barrel domain-containing protein n=1 Tax=Roseovarius azorensis TaxID=1287727 RepID=A0A1H7M6Q0_9RHOB|nr:hypothetical protein [Roseovarius azorensis]SEL06618.1 hypothetical protein SAMN05443999_103214 [Roseovarius azorensis]
MIRSILGAWALLSGIGGAASAQDWNVQVTPYLWGTGVGGSVTPVRGGPTLDFDESLSDILGDLEAAFFLSGYARYGRFVVLGDISASRSSRSGTVPSLGLPVSARLEQRSLTLAAGYRVISEPEVAVDLLAGLRHWRVEAAARTPVPGLAAGLDADFVDPVLAARANVRLAERWSLIGYADIGGFGAGSDFTAQFVATVNWQASESLYLSAGYRHLHVDYNSGGRAFDVKFSGPLVGLTYRF